jgi:hypothetical protein
MTQEAKFTVPLEDKNLVFVNIISKENAVEAFTKVNISEELLRCLEDNESDLDSWPKKLNDELIGIKSLLSKGTRRLLHFVKYYPNNFSLYDLLFAMEDTY